MAKIKDVNAEYERLKSLFLSQDESKMVLVEELIQQASFMKVELRSLQEQIQTFGAVQFSSKGGQRQSESAKYYTKLLNTYSTVIKTLNSILGKNVQDQDDAFDEFIKKANTE